MQTNKPTIFTYSEKNNSPEYSTIPLNTPIVYPEIGKKGHVLDTAINLKHLLDLYQIEVRWNSMLRKREVFVPDKYFFPDEAANMVNAEIYQLAVINGMPYTRLKQHLDSIAWKQQYHPIVEGIKIRAWDGFGRLDGFIKTLRISNPLLTDDSYKIVRRWMICAVAAAFSEYGFANQGVLVLCGKQNIGKTRWVRSLDFLECGAVKEGLTIDPSNKDSVITASQCWIGELGELDSTFRKADIARLKSYITSLVDILRFPYREENSSLYRRTAFVATVNERHFLIDDTGNRRWWTIEVDSIDSDHDLDMQQVWAEVYELYKAGEKTWLLPDELEFVNKSNEEHEQIDPLEEKVLEAFDWGTSRVIQLTSTEVLEKIGYAKPTRSDAMRMNNILCKLTKEKAIRTKTKRLHKMPLLSISWDSKNKQIFKDN